MEQAQGKAILQETEDGKIGISAMLKKISVVEKDIKNSNIITSEKLFQIHAELKEMKNVITRIEDNLKSLDTAMKSWPNNQVCEVPQK